jgi:hypothetical protein
LCTSSTSKRGSPQSASDCSSWRAPRRSNGVHTLLAATRRPACGSVGNSSPSSHSARPYIGDESIMPPPAPKKRRSTSWRGAISAA